MPKWFSSPLVPEAGRVFSLSPVVDSGAMVIQHMVTKSPSPERTSSVLHLGNVTKS